MVILQVFFWALVFSAATAASIALLGDRALIQGDLFNASVLARLLTHWKFVTAMALAFGSRASFIIINNQLLAVPKLAQNSTTITAFITAIAFVFVVGTNALFLGERLSLQQMTGASIIVIGIFVMLW